MRAPTSTSVVVYGIDQRASDERVAAALVRGSAKLLRPEDAERLKTLRVRRLLARAPSGGGTAASAEAQEGADSRITRACRVYLPPDLAQFFCQRRGDDVRLRRTQSQGVRTDAVLLQALPERWGATAPSTTERHGAEGHRVPRA